MTTSRLQNGIDTFSWERYPTANYYNVTYLYARTLTGWGARTYLYFGVPFPKGVTIISARLKMYSSVATAGTVTQQVQRISGSWSANRLTWNASPGVTGTTTQLSKSNPARGTLWDFDVTAMMQTVANGATFYGFRLINTVNTLSALASTQHPTIAWRPMLEITWSDVPKAPTQLYPSSGRAVATNKPTLQCNFTDLSGDTTMAGIQVQINATDVWTAPTFDSGDVPTTEPELDLATTAYAGIPSGGTVFWRVRVKDGAGLWSPWSASTSMVYQTPAILTVNNPAFSEVMRNIVKNPRMGVTTTGWAGGSSAGGTAALTRVATGGPLAEADTFARLTWSVAATAAGSNLYAGSTTTGTYASAVVPGEVWSAAMYVRTSWAANMQLRIQFYTSAGAFVSAAQGDYQVLTANTWTRLVEENVTVPATAAFAIVMAYNGTGTYPGVGATLDGTAAMLVKVATLPTDILYWDGAMTNTSEEEYNWAGTAHQSDTILRRSFVEDATPPIDWTVSGGRTQAAYEVFIQRIITVDTGAYTYSSTRTVWTSGKVMGTTSAITLPANVLTSSSASYRVIVRIWDTVVREAVPGFPNYVQVERIFTLKGTTTVTAVTGLTVTLDTTLPWATLTWSRSSMPDKWNIYRNGKLLTVANGDFFNIGGTSYRAVDRSAPSRVSSTWVVIPVVNGRGAATNPTVTATPKTRTTLLVDKDGNNPLLIWNSDKSLSIEDDGFVFEPTGNAPPIVIFSATKNGVRGSIRGTVSPTTQNITPAQMRARFDALTTVKGQLLYLTMVDETMEVFILNPLLVPRVADGGVIYDISFDFYQTDIS